VRVLMRLWCVTALLTGCMGGTGEIHLRYYELQSLIEKNTRALAQLQPGMSQDGVRAVMGEPAMSEGDLRQTIWFYRTAMRGGVEENIDADFTPVVFDRQGRLIGWGGDGTSMWFRHSNPARTQP
jgi:outer membrane protein assembly factor BamE (lipoprotein component of BamABCDE complex)